MAHVNARLSALDTGETRLEVDGHPAGTYRDPDDAIYAAGMELVHRLRNERDEYQPPEPSTPERNP